MSNRLTLKAVVTNPSLNGITVLLIVREREDAESTIAGSVSHRWWVLGRTGSAVPTKK